MRDETYAAFSAKLIPTVEPDRFIGVRSPQLRAIAKELKNNASEFLSALPHRYHEENMLHAYLLCVGSDYATVVEQTERFLPFVDNWADLMPRIEKWMSAEHEYTVRFGIGTLMRHYLDADFRPEHLRRVAEIHRNEYYIKMMQAWYFATALAKQWDATLPMLDSLEPWVRAKSIQKAIESFRVSPDHKDLLRTLR